MSATAVNPRKIVIVGAGTAGWLSAGLLAARRRPTGEPYFSVTVIEPPDLAPIGVGEGTWPTMRATLKAIGAQESDFLAACNVSLKQGSKFVNWSQNRGESYYHPFEAPLKISGQAASDLWLTQADKTSFSQFASCQEHICERHLAPKLLTSPEFAGVLNYGYHFDSLGFAKFLHHHCEHVLGVKTIPDRMTGIIGKENGNISAIETSGHGCIDGDFFVDCTGFSALLLKQHYGAKFLPLTHILKNNRAVTARVPYSSNCPIQSTTVATAQSAGWIWDVSLATRRGIGYVHSSEHISTDAATAALIAYIDESGGDTSDLSVSELSFTCGHLDRFWINNCAAIGLSAGFIEPLEASSIMLTEIAARYLSEALIEDFENLAIGASEFNRKITKHWADITAFLKLHYVLTERTEPYWQAMTDPLSIPDDLGTQLDAWRREGLSRPDDTNALSLFPHESYQYIWHGMLGRRFSLANQGADAGSALPQAALSTSRREAERLARLLPTNVALLHDRINNTLMEATEVGP